MKIGIFSDVHGAVYALNKTLALFELLGVDEIICAGNLIERGLYSNEVISVMRQRAIPCVQGIVDSNVQYGWRPVEARLYEESIVYLKALPVSLNFEWEETSVHLCHSALLYGVPVNLYPSLPFMYIQAIAAAVDAQIIVFGHTYPPMYIEVDGKLLISPGSIYGNRDREERTCGVLSLPDLEFQIYDIDTGKPLKL